MEKSSPHYTPQFIESWKIPFGVILALHISLAAAVAFMPSFSKKKPRFENIYTIDLIEMASPAQPSPPTPAPQKNEPTKKAVSIAKTVPATPTPIESAQPISISPKKKKIKYKLKPKPTPQKEDRSKIIAKRKRLAELIRQEEIARQDEKDALRDLEEARQLATNPVTRPRSSTQSNSTSTNSGANSLTGVEARWFSAVTSHVLDYWALPEIKLWGPELITTMVITVDRNGRILESYIENPSGDRVFDQFVKKSLQDADPLPPMPAAMRKNKFEIGLNFRPDTIN